MHVVKGDQNGYPVPGGIIGPPVSGGYKYRDLVPQVGGLGVGLTPPHKKDIVKKPESMPAGRTHFRRPRKQKDLRLKTWNVLSLYRTGALRNLVEGTKEDQQ
jgi:hypothetical protein